MALEISTVGASVKYAVESTVGTRPTTGYTAIPDILTAPEIEMSVDTLEVSNITDTYKRYIPGQQDPGSEKSFTANHTEALITAWASAVTAAETGIATGKKMWFEYVYPGATNSYFWSGMPQDLGNSGFDKNSSSSLNLKVVLSDVAGWAAKSTTT